MLLSWHWLFLVNVVPGIVVTIAAITLIDFDKPDYSLLEQLRLGGPDLHGGLPRRARIRARGRPAQRLVRRRHDAVARRRLGAVGASLFFWRVLTGARADRRPARPSPTATSRSARCSPSCSASASTASPISIPVYLGADPRLQRADDRRDDVRLGRRHVPHRAHRRPAHAEGRPAPHADGRLRAASPSAPGG